MVFKKGWNEMNYKNSRGFKISVFIWGDLKQALFEATKSLKSDAIFYKKRLNWIDSGDFELKKSVELDFKSYDSAWRECFRAFKAIK